jgi:hypothetical protein
MDTGRLLLALRLARPARRRGFCPACGVGLTGVPPAVRGVELAADGITVAIVLGVAAVAWAVTAWQMLGSGMAMSTWATAPFMTSCAPRYSTQRSQSRDSRSWVVQDTRS